jgi:hypothetical protein
MPAKPKTRKRQKATAATFTFEEVEDGFEISSESGPHSAPAWCLRSAWPPSYHRFATEASAGRAGACMRLVGGV